MMSGNIRNRSFYPDVLYTKCLNQSLPLLNHHHSNHNSQKNISHRLSSGTRSRERKFSIVYVNDQFVRAIRLMEEVVLVPTRLLDIEVTGEANIPDLISGGNSAVNLYEVFHQLKKFRDRMQAVAMTEEEEMTASLNCAFDGESDLSSDSSLPASLSSSTKSCPSSPFVPKASNCDSGLWSLSSTASSRESIDAFASEDVNSSSSNCNSGTSSISMSGSNADDRSSSHSGEISSESGSSLDSTYVVKKSLLSAKSLCTILTEMTSAANLVVSRYLQEMQCDLCE